MSPQDTSQLRLWQKALLVAGLIWALLVIAPDTYRLFVDLGSLGFTANNDGIVYDDPDAPAARAQVPGRKAAGIVRGDAIALHPGACWHPASRLCQDVLAVFGGMGGLTYVTVGTIVTLPVLRGGDRGGKAVMVKIGPAEKKPLDLAGILLLGLDEAVGLFIICRAFQLAWTQPNAVTIGFFLYMMWFNPGQYFALYAYLQHYPIVLLLQEALQAIAQGAGYAGFLIFALRFPHTAGERRLRNIERMAIGLGVLLAVLQLASFATVFGVQTEALTRTAILGGYGVSFFALYIVWRRRKQQSPLDFQRMRWVVWGCAIGIPAFAFADSNEATSFWSSLGLNLSEGFIEFFFLISGVTAFFVSEAIRKRRVVSVSLGVRRLAVSVVAILLLVALEETLKGFVERPIRDVFAAHPILIFPASIVFVFPLALFGHRFPHVADRFLNRRYHEERHGLEIQAEVLRAATTIEIVDAAVMNGPLAILHLASAAVFRAEDGQLNRICESAEWHRSERHMGKPFEEDCLRDLRAGHPVRLRLQTRRDDDPEAELAAPALAMPIIVGTALYSVALYGPHEGGDDIDPLEIEALERFTQAAATAYEMARLRLLEEQVLELSKQVKPRHKRIKNHAMPVPSQGLGPARIW